VVLCPGHAYFRHSIIARPFLLENRASDEWLVWEPLSLGHFTFAGDEDGDGGELLDAAVRLFITINKSQAMGRQLFFT
jgi:hypothetical protein